MVEQSSFEVKKKIAYIIGNSGNLDSFLNIVYKDVETVKQFARDFDFEARVFLG